MAIAALVATILHAAASGSAGQLLEPGDQRVWQWFASCSSRQTMHATLLLHSKELFAADLPVCILRRADGRDGQLKTLEFTFRAKASEFCDDCAALGEPEIEGNVWLAGGDPDGLILGVSFSTPRRVLLNTLHVAKAGHASESQLANNLVMRTTAVRRGQTKDSK